MRVEIQNPQSKMTFYCDKVEFGRKQEYVLYIFYFKPEYLIFQFRTDAQVSVSLSQIEPTDSLIPHYEDEPDEDGFYDGFPI